MSLVLEEFVQTWRSLIRQPKFLLIASFTLAIGIGSCVTVFNLIDRVLLQPLPYAESDSLYAAGFRQSSGWTAITPNEYEQLQGMDGIARSGLALMQPQPVNIADADRPQMLQAFRVDADFIPALDMPLALGRPFSQSEIRAGSASAVIISHALWQSRFQGRGDVLGETLPVEGHAVPVVGVLPPEIRLTAPFDLMLPLDTSAFGSSGRNFLAPVRPAEGVPAAALSERIRQALQRYHREAEDDGYFANADFGLEPLSRVLGAQSRAVLLLFMASALCVLLLAAVNLANLMLLRTLARQRVLAVRSALGAGFGRLVVPLLGEGLLVGLIGAFGGLLLAWAAFRIGAGWVPAEWHGGTLETAFGSRSFALAMLAGLVPAVLAAVLGLWRGRTAADAVMLRAGGRSGPDRHSGRLSRGLVIVQIALAVMLLTGAGLFLDSLRQASQVDPGFESEGIMTFEIAPVRAMFPDGRSLKRLGEHLVERLTAHPEIRGASGGSNLPAGAPLNYPFRLPGGDLFSVEFRAVTPGYAELFDIPVVAGRALADSDRDGSEAVAQVNHRFARMHLGLEDGSSGSRAVLDRRLMMPAGDGSERTLRIVGVLGDTRQFGPENPPPPMVYLPLEQVPDGLLGMLREFAPLRFAVRGRGAAEPLAEPVRKVLAEVAPGQPIADMRPLAELARAATGETRRNLGLIGIFALLALLLSGVGMYAVVAVATAARNRELAIRAALGARAGSLLGRVLGDGLVQAVIGIVIGLVGAMAIERVAGHVLANLSMSGPLVPAAVALVLCAMALLACLGPALKAAGVAPMEALRDE